ncbi:helix-turn-helix domain-containing protein [Kitasatospora sp. NPDC088264]|uniref:telomere-associated protein Tap n=1 Tax=Kitasatospora sp. NPDC088264 TaxID=3155296 RepID=UPI00341BAB12
MPEEIDPVAALLAQVAEEELPPPAERERLRKAAKLTRPQIAKAVGVREETIWTWEKGRSEPRPPQRGDYARLLRGLAAQFPAPEEPPATAVPEPAVPEVFAGPEQSVQPVMLDQQPDGSLVMGEALPCVQCGQPSVYRTGGRPMHLGGFCRPGAGPAVAVAQQQAAPAVQAVHVAPVAAPRQAAPAAAARRPSAQRPAVASRPGAAARPRKAAPATAKTAVVPDWQQAAAARFPAGPLAVVDVAASGKHLVAHLMDGQVLEVPGKPSVPALTEWTLAAGLGAARLHQWGRDGDPLVVLTDAAATELGLPGPGQGKGDYDPRIGRLPESHRVVKALAKAEWQLTRRGFGPWARVFRTPDGARRECVQYCVPMWGALTSAGWKVPDGLDANGLLRLLGTYATDVITPRGSTAVSGLELMTALRPPTKPVRNEAGGWSSGLVPGSLHQAVDAAPPEVLSVHPLAQGRGEGPDEVLFEEAWDWHRDLTEEEAALPFAVGLDVNTAFLAAAGRLRVGLSEPVHELEPAFDKTLPGSWLVDLSHIELDPRLPSPFTRTGERPTGPAWYATPTVAYATELGAQVRPLEGWLRHEAGPYLDPWHDRLNAAYKAAMARLGVPADLADHGLDLFQEVMTTVKETGDPVDLAVLAAIKATAKGGIGKLRERPRGADYRPGQPWPALERPTWRPDIRAAVISTARVNFHRKLLKTAAVTGRYPVAVLSDCAVYPTTVPGVQGVVALGPDGKQVPGTLRLGVAPGMVKFEGARPLAEIQQFIADGFNPARHIKPGTDAVAEGE